MASLMGRLRAVRGSTRVGLLQVSGAVLIAVGAGTWHVGVGLAVGGAMAFVLAGLVEP